jgi:hypothetical protein
MATTDDFPRSNDEVRCTYHPSVMTRLRCSRCGKPICPRCGVRTPVGLRCPECAGVRGLPTYRTDSGTLVKAIGGGALVAVAIGVVWGYIPTWNFYLALLLGFAVAETMARLSNAKRGPDLQAAAVAAVVLGLIVSRAVMAHRYGIPFSQINDLSGFVIVDGFRKSVEDALYLHIIPDGLFAGIAGLIVWHRFR